METEVVYVCTTDRHYQLITSLDTLYNSGSTFDQVTIYLIGKECTKWKFSKPSIVVNIVPPLFGKYQFGNKIYLCKSKAERVIFLDTDTFVLKNLDPLWGKSQSDIMARVASWYGQSGWYSEIWNDTCGRLNIPITPMFNSGFIMFQNRAHNKIENGWKECILKYLRKEFVLPVDDDIMEEQCSFALSVGLAGLSVFHLEPTEHAFGWKNDSHKDTIILHTANAFYDKYYYRFAFDSRMKHKLQPAFESSLRFSKTENLLHTFSFFIKTGYEYLLTRIKNGLKRLLPNNIIVLIRKYRFERNGQPETESTLKSQKKILA